MATTADCPWKRENMLVLLSILIFVPNIFCQNAHAPVFPAQPTTYKVSELTSVGGDVFTCVATDDDTDLAATLSYSIVGGSGNTIFSVNNVTCDVTVAQQLNYESESVYDVIIQAVDHDPVSPKSATVTFTIQVTDVNEYTPTFVNVPPLPVAVPENSTTGTTVFTCTVSDGDSPSAPSGRHSFNITGGNLENKFTLDNATCDLTLADGLDFENVSQHDVTITASDLDPVDSRSVSMVFSVEVVDVNEKPTFKNLPGDPVLVREDVTMGTEIFKCSGRDPDLRTLPRGQLEYSIVGGNDTAFSLDPSTCKLTVSVSLDFEAVAEYQLTLKAQDQDPEQKMSVARPLVITVLDVNEHPPTFVNVPTSPTEVGELSSVGSMVITCTANDLDSATQPSGQLRFLITGGNEEGRFTLQDESVCLVSVGQALDFETREFYSLILTVQDLDPNITFSATETFQILVTDENDAPVLSSIPVMPTVAENSPAGTFVFDCSAMDQDDASLLSGQLNYSIISGNTNDSFTLTAPCRVETSRPLDHETQVLYDLEIRVTDLDPADPKTDTRVYTTKVTDVNDNTPYFLRDLPPVVITIEEDFPVGVRLLNCSGDDDDTPLELTGQVGYEIIAGNVEGFFTVNNETCDLSLTRPVDYETTTLTFNITVRICDLDPIAPRSAEKEYKFCVGNMNDNVPRFVSSLPSLTRLIEHSPLGIHLGRCSAVDDDSSLFPSGHVRYKISKGNSLSLFYMDPYTCDLYVNGLLDFEQKRSHTLKVIAVDLDPYGPLQTEVVKVKVRLLEDNDYGPTCQSRIMTTEMSEDTKAKSVVTTLNCTDLDQGRSTSALRFKAISSTKTLSVVKMTGEVRLKRQLDWDDVTEPREHELIVKVRDNFVRSMSATVTVRIILTDSDDQKPVFQELDYVEYVNEDLPRGTTVLSVYASDSDAPDTPASTVQYGIHTVDPSSSQDCFLVHPYTGEVILKRALDAESFTESRFEVFAFSSDLSEERAVAGVTVHVGNVNDAGPEFLQEVYNISVQEATTYSTPVLRVLAQDSDSDDGGEVRYTIEDGPLAIDDVSGDVTVKGQLDFETQYYYALRVEARDLGTPSLTGTSIIIITVTPLNEFDPVWISGTDYAVSEDAVPDTVVFQLNATDDDSSWDGEVNYRSSATLDLLLSPFSVDQSGRVLLAAPLDRETTDSYTFSVVAHDLAANADDRRSVTTTVHVTVSDVNDLAPDCRSLPVSVVVYPWVGSAVASMDCSVDADLVNGRLGYRIVGGNVDGAFQINSTNGRLTATRPPTLELYELSVEASDGGTPAMTSVVDVVIVVEPKLTLTGSTPGSALTREDATVGTLVHRVTACCSFTTLGYELLSGNDDQLFHLNRGTGVITLVRHLDREVTSQHVLRVKVGDERGQAATATLEVTVEDVNDNPPVFNPVFSFLKLPETTLAAGVILGQWTATDADQGSNGALTYSLLDSANGCFSVDSSTGVVTVVKDLDHEGSAGDTVTFVMEAVDGGDVPLSATATVQVEIVNVDEHSPQFLTTSGNVTLAENSPLGVVLFVLEASDQDLPDVLSYSLTNVGTPFLVLPDGGQVVLRSPLDRESVDQYSLQFMATNDKGDSAALDVEIHVEDVDDNDPVFTSSVYEFHVPHDTQADVIVGHVVVTDDDVGENAEFTISIVSGNGAVYFALEGVGGLKTTRPLRYDGVREFILVLRAQKVGSLSEYHFSEAAVRIEVQPAQIQPKFDSNSLTLTVSENVVINTVICDVNATALGATEGEDGGTLRYVISSGNNKGIFYVKEHTGELQVLGGIDYESDTQFVLEVEAQNKNDPAVTDSITVTVNVINVNDHSPHPDSVIFRFSVDEGSLTNTFVGHVIFTDDDADVFGEFTHTISGCPKFIIHSITGDITVKDPLTQWDDVRQGCVVTATDGGEPPRSGMTSVVIEVREVNDHTPEFVGAPYSLDVYENTPVGSTLTTVIAADPDDGEKGEVSFSIESGDPDSVFSLNASTGHLRLNAPLSAPHTSQFLLRLRAQDGGNPSLTSFTTLTINVIDVNDHAPVFAASSTSVEVTVGRLDPPGTELWVLSASDEDLGDNSRVSFAITAGNAEGFFFVDADSGQLTTRGWLTRASNTHLLALIATDHGRPVPLDTTTTFTIYISPPWTSLEQPSPHFQSFSVPENASVDSVVGILDPFPASHADDYVIVSGNHDDSFEVVMMQGGGEEVWLVVKAELDYETHKVYYLWLNVTGDEESGFFRKLVQVNVTDVNDHTPQFDDGPTLALRVAEHTPAGHTLWSLSVHDADQPDTNGPLQFRVDSATVPNVLNVTAEGHIQLMSSPDYSSFQQVEAEISVWDSYAPQLSSSIAVTLDVIDVDEREFVTVTPAVTMYISTETARNTNEGQVVYRLTAADFKMTEPPSSSTVSFVSFNTNGAFAIHDQTGEVTVSDPQRLADDTVYFQWVVCKIVAADASVQSEIATLRIDTYDKYKNVVAVQFGLGVSDVDSQRSALLQKLQSFFSNTQRVGIYAVIAYGATTSLVLIYVVEDVSADELNNIMGPKTFLTQDQILQVLQYSSDGTPVAGLTLGPLAAELVMPYLTGDGHDSDSDSSSSSFTDSLHFPIIVAVLCLLVVVVVIFVIGCLVYRAKRKRMWSRESAAKGFKTPAPAFYIRKDSHFPDDVSIASSTSLLDDDSGVGDSVGSRSLPRKSLTPSSSGSDQSDDDNDYGRNESELTLSPNTLLNGQAVTSGKGSWKPSANSANDAATSRRPRRKRVLWRKSQPKTTKDKFVHTAPKPPVSWLPSLPNDPRLGDQDSSLSWLESPRYGRRASGFNVESYNPSDPASRKSCSQSWESISFATPSRAGSEDSPSSSRRSSLSIDWGTSPYAIPLSGRGASAARVTTPVFTTGISGIGASSAYTPSAWSSNHQQKPWDLDYDYDYSDAKATIPGHLVSWKPKRNTVKIFHEKLEWKAVSTIPKATPLPRRRTNPTGLKANSIAGTLASSRDINGTQTSSLPNITGT